MKKIIILSGVSGAGKSTASNLLEDMGYKCIDQYPIELLENLINLIQNDNSSKYENVVLTIPINDLEKYESLIRNVELHPILILMDADKEEIINRYKFTRRIHPLLLSNVVNTLGEAIDVEKGLIVKYNKRGVFVIDTTKISLKRHKMMLDKIVNNKMVKNNLSISFLSFGFKNGVPNDADNIFDVRFLDNPFYDPKLKNKTGKDKTVKEFVLSKKTTQVYLKKLISYLDYLFKHYSKEEKRHLTICIGCTGGRHRSVVIADYLYNLYKNTYICYINHREIEQ